MGLKPNRSQSDWKRGRCSALRVVISRGFDQRSSPSVSIVMNKGVSDMARFARCEQTGVGGVDAHDFLECVEVGGQDPVFAVFPGHERAAPIACRPPRCRVTQEVSDRSGNLRSGARSDAETLALDYAVRIDKRHYGYASYPSLKVRIRKSFDVGGVD